MILDLFRAWSLSLSPESPGWWQTHHQFPGRVIPGDSVVDSEAGCCGMAGAFGYEAEHAELSRIITGQRLLPRLDKTDLETRVVANGFSCRYQIADLSGRWPRHVMELVREFL